MIKKITATALLLVVTLLTGCGDRRTAAKPEVVSGEFDKAAQMTFNGRSYKAQLRRGGEGVWECEFTEPECIAGLRLTNDVSGCMMEYDGLEYMTGDMPRYALMPLLTGALDDVISGSEVSCTEGKDCTDETGQISGQTFTAKVKNGEVISMEIKGVLSAEFS